MAKTATKKSPASQPTNGSAASTQPVSATPQVASLPASIVNALPAGADIIKHVQAIEALLPLLQKQVRAAEKAGPVQLARAFVVMHRLQKRMLSDEEAFKDFKAWHREVKEHLVPQCFEQAGIENVPLSEGYRVGTSEAWRASIKPDQKVGAYTWLKENEKGDIIQPTVNASTLSALAKQMAEANEELPEEFFNCAQVPSTSVTAIKK